MTEKDSLPLEGEVVAERILVADDEEIVREMLFTYLVDEGYCAETAADGHEAVEKVQSGRYDVVITDIRMPGPNGIEVLRAAKNAHPDTEVIVMTAFSTEDMAIEAVRLGAYDYLKKPIDDLGLFALLVRQILAKQALARENSRLLEDLSKKNTELNSANHKLVSMATTDPLTGAYNRRYILARLEQQFQQMQRYGDSFALLMLDIDHFKQINDTHGHQVGDEVLKQFVNTVEGLIRSTDLFGRYGGEEFLLLLHGTVPEDALHTAERVREEVETPHYVAGPVSLQFTVSAGLAVSPYVSVGSPAEMVRAADMALYDAKNGGRNRVVVAEPAQEPEDELVAAQDDRATG